MKRSIAETLEARPTMDGAGVRLMRVFGNSEVNRFDPFLLLDDFRSDDPNDYIAGFPWHPHRGMETVSYMISGKMRHGDSMGNSGVIEGGGIQWMTAGGGIVHQEMPEQEEGLLWGTQLWVNLPSSSKLMAPRYQDIQPSEVPEVPLEGGGAVRVLAGAFADQVGPVKDVIVSPLYLDVELTGGEKFSLSVSAEKNAFAYLLEGSGVFAPDADATQSKHVVRYGPGNEVEVVAGMDGVRFLLVAGKPLKESVAWRGPIVMNTQEELMEAFEEYRNGTFLKSQK